MSPSAQFCLGLSPELREAKTFANANFGFMKSSLIALDMVSVGYDDVGPCCGSVLTNLQHSLWCLVAVTREVIG